MQVRITDNFLANLAVIESFLNEAGADSAYDALLESLKQSLIPHLAAHPRMGKDFMARPTESHEARQKAAGIITMAGKAEVREVILGDYLVLYALQDAVINLLSIRHHRQLSFDFLSFWEP